MKNYFFILFVVIVAIFSGCSSKKVYEPKLLKSDWDNQHNINKNIIDTSSNVALLDNGQILTKTGYINKNIIPIIFIIICLLFIK